MNKILSLTQSHSKRIFRDSFLLFISFLPFLMGLLYRILIPELRQLLISHFDLSLYYPLIMLFLVMMSPLLFGWVIGFSLLDDRDEDILAYMSITPLQKTGYLQFKIIAPVFISIIQGYLVLLIANLCPMDYIKLLPVIILAAMEAPLFALAQGVFAGNKVEGLAVGKLLGLVLIGPFISYFVDSPLAYLAGIIPPFWITETYFSEGPQYWMGLGIGLVVHIIFLIGMSKLFNKRQG